ncbi:MAG: hypothetical protein KC643_15745 [Nitrospira sp.]|nr:hypothetical protein [Nitrospira sp.]
MASLFREFISNCLNGFEGHLRNLGMSDSTIVERMKGAREFARFLVGDPHAFNERTKGTI